MSTPDDSAETLSDSVVNPESPTAAPAPNDNLHYGRYTVIRREDGSPWELGRGGMGVTYKAEDPELRRPVVLKVILPTLFNHDPQARARFRREARSAAGVHHASIATVFDIGEAHGEDYYVMEFIAGEDLLTRLRRDGSMDVLTTLRLGKQVAEALDAAWDPARIVHRDLKPANLMLARRPGGAAREAREGPLVKVVDFGLAKAIKAAGEMADAAGAATGLSSNARPIFSAAYASPEQIDGDVELDIRSDLYSLGVTLWHCLVGHPTFGNTSQQKAVVGHLSKPPPFEELQDAGVPAGVVALLRRLLAKDPAERPASPDAVLEEFDGLLQGEAVTAASPVMFQHEEPAVGEASFTLADVLRQRGTLTPEEALTLLEALAPLTDASWVGATGEGETAGLDLNPARIRVRLDAPLPTAEDLCAVSAGPMDNWPASSLHLDAADGPAASEGTASLTTLGQTLPAPSGRVALTPAGALAALGYELIGGQPPAPGRWRPLPALDEAGNDLLRDALEPNPRFPTAAEFVRAWRASTVSGGIPAPELMEAAAVMPSEPELPTAFTSHVPVAPTPGRGPGRLVFAALGLAAVVVAGVILMLRPAKQTTSAPTPTVALTPTPEPTSTPELTPATPPNATDPARKLREDGFEAHSKGDYSRAITLFTQAIDLNPQDSLSFSGRANAYRFFRKFENAIADNTKAIELNPKSVVAYYQRGFVYSADLKQHERALADFAKSIELDPDNASSPYSMRGNAFKELKQYERALTDSNKAIELSPGTAFLYGNRGLIYNALNQPERAIVDINKAIELKPKDYFFYEARGSAYATLKEWERAVADFTKAIEINPNRPLPYFKRSSAYKALGKNAEAEQDFGRGKATERSNP